MVGSVCGPAATSGLGVVPFDFTPLDMILALLPYVAIALVVGIGGGVVVTLACRKRLRWALLWSPLCVLVVGGTEFGILLLVAGNKSAPRPPAPPVTAVRAGGDWPAFRAGPSRCGAVPDGPDPIRAGDVWTQKRPAGYLASAAVVGNRVFITSADRGVFSDRGQVLCLDADTGGLVWRFSPADYRATFSSPSVAEAYVVVGEGLEETEDARVFCLNAKTGARRWSYRTRSYVESSPCIDLPGRRTFIGAGDDGLFCFALDADENGKATVLWHLKGPKSTEGRAGPNGAPYVGADASPICHDGRVYFGLGLGGEALVCLAADTGRELWRISTGPYPVFCPPSIDGDRLFVGMGHGDFVSKAEALGKPPGGEVWCVDLKTRKVLWKVKTARVVLGAVAVRDGRACFGDRSGTFHCISTADGSPVAKATARSPIVTSPAVGKKHAYFVTERGRLRCLSLPDLKDVWHMQLGGEGMYVSSPVVGRGHVYVGTSEDGLRCVGRGE